jgi:hypothetical protein
VSRATGRPARAISTSGKHTGRRVAERLIAGGRTGPGVVPGEPGKGWLMHTITLAEGRYKMPPGPVPIPPEDISMIREWIRQGAP